MNMNDQTQARTDRAEARRAKLAIISAAVIFFTASAIVEWMVPIPA